MLVINEGNLNIFGSGISVRQVVERYESTLIDLPKDTIKSLLRNGDLTREFMLRSWIHAIPEDVEQMGIDLMPRNELWAITKNPKLARLALKHREVVEALGSHTLGRAFDHITLPEADEYDVQLHEVIGNPTVSVEVKRSLIQKAFQSGELPIKEVDALRKYVHADVTIELVRQLEQINYPERLIDPSLLERPAMRRYNDLSSRLMLVLCGCFDVELVERMLETDLSQLSAVEYCVWFKGPTTNTQTEELLHKFGDKPATVKYLAAKGHFDDATLNEMIKRINKYGDGSDMVSLYENSHLTNGQQKTVHKQVSPCIPLGSVRRRLFDSYIVNATKAELDDFCQTWYHDPAMMFMITSPRAFKRAGLHCISRIDPDGVTAFDIITKCSGEEFTEHEAGILMSQVLASHDDDLVTRFILMVGIPTKIKHDLVRCIGDSRRAA